MKIQALNERKNQNKKYYADEQEKMLNSKLQSDKVDKLELEQLFQETIEYDGNDMFHIKIPQFPKLIDIRKHPLFKEEYCHIIVNDQEEAWKIYLKKWRIAHFQFWRIIELNNPSDLKKVLKNTQYQLYPINVDAIKQFNYTGAHVAAQNGFLEILEILYQNNADLMALTKDKRTPLHLACQFNHLQIVQFLCEKDCNLNFQDIENNTPLHLACIYGHEQIVEFLLSRVGINLFQQNLQFLCPYNACGSAKVQDVFKKMGFINQNVISRDLKHTYIVHIILQQRLFNKQKLRINNTLLLNGKTDHLEKFINICRKYFFKKTIDEIIRKNQQNSLKINQDQNNSENNLDLIFVKQQLNAIRQEIERKMQKIEFFDISPNSQQKYKVNPNSFIYMKVLGQGAFGKVYLAKQQQTVQLTDSPNQPTYYAIKVLDKNSMQKQNLMKYVHTEKKVLSFINNPFMVRLYYAFQTQQKLFLVMSYCPGGDMGQLLAKKKYLSEEIAKMYLAEIIIALETLHNSFIVFRDLKPDNIVFDEEGHACLTDFGLSKEGMALNKSISFVGSVAFLAPEILSGMGHNRTVDWYLLGTLLYVMLVGIPPYYDKNQNQLFQNILKGPLIIPKSMSNSARNLLISLLNRNPSKRLGSKNDAEDIKTHEFFNDINWEDVIKRKLPVPKPEISTEILQSSINIQFEESNFNNIDNWDYIKNYA